MKFDIFKDSAGEWRWRLVEVNGRIIATSGESYTRKADVSRAVAHVIARIRAFTA